MPRYRKQKKEWIDLKVRYCDVVQPRRNFLKYNKVAKFWALKKYKLNDADLDMLFFLIDEQLFTASDFEKYERIHRWDKNRFKKLVRTEWIVKWRTEGQDSNRFALYAVSSKGKRMVDYYYQLLNGEILYSEIPHNNPVMKGESQADRKMSMTMKEINKEILDNRREKLRKPVHRRRDERR